MQDSAIIKTTGVITGGAVLFFASLFGFLAISGDHDAAVNKVEYTAAARACGHASDITSCLALVNNAFQDDSGN